MEKEIYRLKKATVEYTICFEDSPYREEETGRYDVDVRHDLRTSDDERDCPDWGAWEPLGTFRSKEAAIQCIAEKSCGGNCEHNGEVKPHLVQYDGQIGVGEVVKYLCENCAFQLEESIRMRNEGKALPQFNLPYSKYDSFELDVKLHEESDKDSDDAFRIVSIKEQ